MTRGERGDIPVARRKALSRRRQPSQRRSRPSTRRSWRATSSAGRAWGADGGEGRDYVDGLAARIAELGPGRDAISEAVFHELVMRAGCGIRRHRRARRGSAARARRRSRVDTRPRWRRAGPRAGASSRGWCRQGPDRHAGRSGAEIESPARRNLSLTRRRLPKPRAPDTPSCWMKMGAKRRRRCRRRSPCGGRA